MRRSFRFRQYPVERNHFSAAQAVFGTAARTWSFWPRSSCILFVGVNQGELEALVVRGYLAEEERDNGAALKKAIEAVLSDIELDLQSEAAERTRARA